MDAGPCKSTTSHSGHQEGQYSSERSEKGTLWEFHDAFYHSGNSIVLRLCNHPEIRGNLGLELESMQGELNWASRWRVGSPAPWLLGFRSALEFMPSHEWGNGMVDVPLCSGWQYAGALCWGLASLLWPLRCHSVGDPDMTWPQFSGGWHCVLWYHVNCISWATHKHCRHWKWSTCMWFYHCLACRSLGHPARVKPIACICWSC